MSKKQVAELAASQDQTNMAGSDQVVQQPADPAVDKPADPAAPPAGDPAAEEAPAPAPVPLWEPHEEVPSAGGSYIRQPDGSLIKAEEA